MGKPLLFPEWKPDLTETGTGVSKIIQGCVPRADGYGPFPDLSALTESLPGPCRGYYYARRSSGAIAVFAGTATRLYILNNTDLTWADVSKGATDYSPLLDGAHWQFRQFNDVVIAVQVGTAPQKFTLSSSSAFEDLGGTPPLAAYIAVVNRFIVLSGLLSNPRRIQWCDLDAIETWTAGVGLSDFQDLPDGGNAGQISGGDAYGLVFQDESIRSLVYAPGSPVVFQITRISVNEPLFAPYSVINAGEKTFFCSAQGFKVYTPGASTPTPIGKDRVDETFWADVDFSSLQLVIGATDPTQTRVYWSYKSKSGDAGLFDKILCYDWSVGRAGEWTLIPMSGEYLAALAAPGITLDGLDVVAPTPLNVVDATDNGSGEIRLELNALSNSNFDIDGQNFIVVYGVTGTTEANGTWEFTIIDATHIDLVGSTFANAYVSGGHIGGSLDALDFSLDSVSRSAVARMSAVTPDHKVGFFDGDYIEAILETDEQDGQGTFMFANEVLVMADCPEASVTIGFRDSTLQAVEYLDEQSVDSSNRIYPLVEARYLRAKVRMPAGSVWSYARGVQPEAQAAGTE